MTKLIECYLSLGTNLGDKHGNIGEAIRLIGERVGDVLRVSSYLETEPWGFVSDNSFVNACVKVQTTLTPMELLDATQQIEHDMGRTRKSTDGHYHDRIIDIDILLYGDITVDEPRLKIPHPLMNERDFVKIPLNEIKDEEDFHSADDCTPHAVM